MSTVSAKVNTMQASGEHTQASSIYKIYQSLCNISVSISQCNISVSVFRIYTGSLDFVGSSTGSAAFQEVDISMYTPAIIEKFPDSTHIYHSASVSIYIFFNISVSLHDIYQSHHTLFFNINAAYKSFYTTQHFHSPLFFR